MEFILRFFRFIRKTVRAGVRCGQRDIMQSSVGVQCFFQESFASLSTLREKERAEMLANGWTLSTSAPRHE